MQSPNKSAESATADVAVIGAGFGGLGAAFELARGGAKVHVFEALRYPGGCASTFTRSGFRFDAGATVASGLLPNQFFGKILEKYAPEIVLDWNDPIAELRTPSMSLVIARDRAKLLETFARFPDAPRERLRAFFEEQQRVAEVMWSLFDESDLLPPFSARTIFSHAARLARYAGLLRWTNTPLVAALAHFGLEGFEPLRHYLDALCQITVQCDAESAEAPLAFAAMDYYYRGTAHVHGGVGTLADTMVHAARTEGAEFHFSDRVEAVKRESNSLWHLKTRRGSVLAKHVVANMTPPSLHALLPAHTQLPEQITVRGRELDEAWGAAMLYRIVRAHPAAESSMRHLELVADPTAAFVDGNHVFVSFSHADELNRAPAGTRAATVSTHVSLKQSQGPHAAAYLDGVHERMRSTLSLLAPEWEGVEHEMSASPRTFARFVGRVGGGVGGLPRRVGWNNYTQIAPIEALPHLWMVGDSFFPGQSMLACAIGGTRTARAILA